MFDFELDELEKEFLENEKKEREEAQNSMRKLQYSIIENILNYDDSHFYNDSMNWCDYENIACKE